jgi:hypothetical protein
MNILLFIPKDITTNTNVKKVDLIGFQTYHILKNVHKVCVLVPFKVKTLGYT